MATVSYQVLENIRDVSNVFNKISQPETAFLNRVRIGQAVKATKHFWWDDQRKPAGTTLGAGYTQATANGVLTVASSTGLSVGNLINVAGQIKRVSVVTNGTTITTVHIGGAADADIANSTAVKFLFGGQLEGQDYSDGDYKSKVERNNVTEIFEGFINISGTELAVQREINSDLFLDEIQRELERQRLGLGRSLWDNIKVIPSDNATPRIFGGLLEFVAANGYAPAAAAFSADNFDTFLYQIRAINGGSVKDVWMNPIELANFTGLDATRLIKGYNDLTIGRTVTKYISKYGDEVNLNTDVQAPVKKLVITDSSLVELKPMEGRAFFYSELAKTGDNKKGMITGEYTLEVRNSATMGVYTIS